MRIKLPWYDVNYRDGSDHNTPAGKKIAELNSFLRENGITWWIACLDEKWKVVQRYTDRVVLEIDDSVSPEKLEKIKKFVSELLKVMWATESQLADVFYDEKDKEWEMSLINVANWKMRFELPWYDANYRDGSDYNTLAGKKIAELNSFLMENWIRWWIACLDEKGQTVQRYTDRVVLEIDDSVSPEKLEKIKKKVSELLRVIRTA